MKINKRLLFSQLLLIVLVVFAGCSPDIENRDSKSNKITDKETNNINYLSILTGSTQGTYYPLGNSFAEYIESETGIPTSAKVSQASAANIYALSQGLGDIAFVQTDIAFYATEKLFMFENAKVDNISALGTLYPETIQLVTTNDSGIHSYKDLKGKTVSVGAPESGVFANAKQLLEINGISMKDIKVQRLGFGNSIEALKLGQIDAAFITAGTPTEAVEILNKSMGVNVIGIDNDILEKLLDKYPYYSKDVIKKGTYGLLHDVNTVSVSAMLIVRDDLPEDIVYHITKAIYENANKLKHPKGKFIQIKTALDGIGIKVHPGALKYFNEVKN